MELIYRVFATLDYIVFSVVKSLFVLINDLANYNFLGRSDSNVIGDFTSKIYIVLGILMLFKIIISAIQYVINPDTFSDNSKGFGSLLKRTVISIFMILIIPTLFEFLMTIQAQVVIQLPKAILANNTNSVVRSSDDGYQVMDKAGDSIPIAIFDTFLKAKTGRTPTYTLSSLSKIDDLRQVVLDGCKASILSGEFWNGEKCNYEYSWLLSTICGIFLIFMLLSMAIDVATRTIKLGLIRILSPIPVANYITDENKLKEFGKTALQIYADLFIRLAIIYFVVFILLLVLDEMKSGIKLDNGVVVGVSDTRAIFIKLFVIVALILFAKTAPKFICDILGIKGADESIGNMFKRAGGLFGATVGTGRALYAARRNSRNEIEQKARAGIKDKDWNNMSARERRDKLKKAAKEYGRFRRYDAIARSTGSAMKSGLLGSFFHNQGYKDIMSNSKNSADRSYAISKDLAEKGVTRGQYRREVLNRRLGVESSFAQMTAEAESSRSISNSANASLDMAHNILGDKMAMAQLTEAYINQIKGLNDGGSNYKALNEAFNFKITNKNGNVSYSVNIDELNADKGGNLTLAAVQSKLQEIMSDTTGRYDENERSLARGQLDMLNGAIDNFIIGQEAILAHNEPTTSNAKLNPKLSSAIQATRDEFGKFASTPFGQAMIKKGKEIGIIDSKGNIIHGLEGVWEQMIKKEGINTETSLKAAMGKQELAGMSVKEIADKFDKKS